METGICHKCGQQIFNGIPQGRDIEEFVKEMKSKSFELGYFHKMVGSFGHPLEERKIKPICSACSKKESDIQRAKDSKKAIRTIGKTIKKQFSCPICEDSAYHGYNVIIFKSSTKQEMIDHIKEKHTLSEVQTIIRRNE